MKPRKPMVTSHLSFMSDISFDLRRLYRIQLSGEVRAKAIFTSPTDDIALSSLVFLKWLGEYYG